MLLNNKGYTKEASLIEKSVMKIIKSKKSVTFDLHPKKAVGTTQIEHPFHKYQELSDHLP